MKLDSSTVFARLAARISSAKHPRRGHLKTVLPTIAECVLESRLLLSASSDDEIADPGDTTGGDTGGSTGDTNAGATGGDTLTNSGDTITGGTGGDTNTGGTGGDTNTGGTGGDTISDETTISTQGLGASRSKRLMKKTSPHPVQRTHVMEQLVVRNLPHNSSRTQMLGH